MPEVLELSQPSSETERMTDFEIGELLSAMGNLEGKALLVAAMKPGVTYTSSELTSLFNEIQGEDPAWEIEGDNHLPRSYCDHSLAPFGLVERVSDETETGAVRYIKTEYGEVVGDALAGYLLEFSLDHPGVTLQELFGRTSTMSPEELRAPMARLAIIGELLTRELPVRVTDLDESETFTPSSEHAHSLAKNGLIDLTKRSNSDPIKTYGIGETPFSELVFKPTKSPLPTAIRGLIEARSQSGEGAVSFDSQQILEELSQDPTFASWDQQSLKKQVHQTLRNLARRGAIKNIGEFDDWNHSIIDVRPEQAEVLGELLSLIYAFQENDEEFLRQGRQKAQAILEDPVKVSALLAKAREVSPHANRKGEEDRGSMIANVLAAKPNSTPQEIEKHLKEEGIAYSKHSIRRVLQELEAKELVSKVKRNKKMVWFLVSHIEEES